MPSGTKLFPWRIAFPDAADWDAPIETGTVPAILERAAMTWPDRAAIEFRDRQLTYRELARRADALAAGLARMGIGRDQSVALYLPNTPWHPLAFFAVARTGARLVQLSPLDAPLELAWKLRDSGARLVVTTNLPPMLANALRLVEEGAAERLLVAEDAGWGAGPVPPLSVPSGPRIGTLPHADAPSTWPRLAADDICLLQYTGGTTGVPKAAMLSHRNLTAAVGMGAHWRDGAPGPGPKRVIAALPLFHIYALGSVLLRQVAAGNELLLRTRFDVDAVLNDITRKRAGVFPGVPTMWIALANHPRAAASDFSSLESCSCGGAPLAIEVRERVERLIERRLLGGWGMTETSGCGTRIPLTAAPAAGVIGVPLPGVEMRVVDRDDPTQILPPEVAGELAIRGANVFSGYWSRAEESAAAFCEGYFLTGDIGVMDAGGCFRLLDRKKNMIISGGYNVYPAIVENALYEHPAVAEAIVIGIPDPYRGESAKAFISLRPGKPVPTLGELNAFLAERLGRHELPVALEVRRSLPKSPTGKLMARILRDEERAKICNRL